jgi:hypothetical protein
MRMPIKKLKNIPKKVYVYDAAQNNFGLFEYYGTDLEDPTAPFVPCNYHIFIKDMGLPTVEKYEIGTFEFDLEIDQENIFTSKKECEKWCKKEIEEEILRIEEQIVQLENDKKQLEKILTRSK